MRRILIPSLCSLVGFGACSDDPGSVKGQRLAITPAAAQTAAITNVRAIAAELREAEVWIGETNSVSGLEDVLGIGDSAAPTPVPLPNGLVLPDDDAEFEQMMDDIEGFLDERVFVDAQLESQSETEVVYKLTPAVMCGEGEDADPDCVELFGEVELRVRATSYREGDVDLDVLVGAGRDKLLGLELHADMVALNVDLAAADAIVETLVEGESGTSVQLAGEVSVSARRLTADKIRLEGGVGSNVRVEVVDGEDTVEIEAAPGSVALEVDQASKRAVLDVDVGGGSLTMPKHFLQSSEECYGWSEVDANGNETWYEECEPVEVTPATGTLTVASEGFAAYFELDDTAEQIALDGLVVRPIKVLADGETAMELALGGGQPFDLDIASGEDAVTLTASRAMEMSMLMRLGGLADLMEDMPAWAEDEQLGVSLAGAKPSVAIHDRGLVVGAGTTLTLTSRHARATTLVAEAGQCLFFEDTSSDVPVEPAEPTDPGAPVPEEVVEESTHPFDFTVADQCPAPVEDTTEPM